MPCRTEWVLTYTDPADGPGRPLRGRGIPDFPTVEWTVYFRNTGAADTPILADIQALDLPLARGALRRMGAPPCRRQPLPDQRLRAPDPRCWPGDHAAHRRRRRDGPPTATCPTSAWKRPWARGSSSPSAGRAVGLGMGPRRRRGLRVRGGQELTPPGAASGRGDPHPPGRLQFWAGDWLRAQNVWRRWMLAHNVPRPEGKLPHRSCSAAPPTSSTRWWRRTNRTRSSAWTATCRSACR